MAAEDQEFQKILSLCELEKAVLTAGNILYFSQDVCAQSANKDLSSEDIARIIILISKVECFLEKEKNDPLDTSQETKHGLVVGHLIDARQNIKGEERSQVKKVFAA